MTIKSKKLKVLIVGREAEAQASNAVISVRGDNAMSSFKYLGSMFTSDNTLDAEINHRLASAKGPFYSCKRPKCGLPEPCL